MKVLIAAFAAAILATGNAAFAACSDNVAEKPQPEQTVAKLPVLPPVKSGS